MGQSPTCRASRAITYVLALAFAGCGPGELGTTKEHESAITSLPADPTWPSGIQTDSLIAGSDVDGAPEYVCRAIINGSIQPGKTKWGWNGCDIGYGTFEFLVSPFQTLVPQWYGESGAFTPSVFDYAFGTDSDGAPLYTCRASWGGGVHDGKIRQGFTGCYIPYGNQEVHVASYEILQTANYPLMLTGVNGANIPPNAVVGRVDSDGTPFYPCVAWYQYGYQPGKTRRDWGSCDVSWGGGEHFVGPGYYVLVMRFNTSTITTVVGNDGDASPLGICNAQYGASRQVGKYMTNGVCSFGYSGKEVMLSTGIQVLTLGPDACGASGQHCCATIDCDFGLTCQSGQCVPCGANSQPCCQGNRCNSDQTCASGTCVLPAYVAPATCGVLGLACCSGATPCPGGGGLACVNNQCTYCGNQNQACCQHKEAGGSACWGTLGCNFGFCSLCGQGSQPCCSKSSTGCQGLYQCDPNTIMCVPPPGNMNPGCPAGCGTAGCQCCPMTNIAGCRCNPGTVLQGGITCVPCGGRGQPCCDTGTTLWCNNGSACSGGTCP